MSIVKSISCIRLFNKQARSKVARIGHLGDQKIAAIATCQEC